MVGPADRIKLAMVEFSLPLVGWPLISRTKSPALKPASSDGEFGSTLVMIGRETSSPPLRLLTLALDKDLFEAVERDKPMPG